MEALTFKVQFTVTHTVSEQRVRDMLVSAFEGGSNYWYLDAVPVLTAGLTADDYKEGGKLQPKAQNGAEDYHHWTQVLPFIDGCAVDMKVIESIHEDDSPDKEYRLNRAALERGLKVLAEKYPHHFANLLQENDDADTGDAFLQCCLFGETVYG